MRTESNPATVPSQSEGRAPNQPLTGLRILEISDSPAAAFASVLLADLGASVIVCEPPSGSALRRLGPEAVQAVWWPIIARNKASVTIDLDEPATLDRLGALLTECDLVIRDRTLPLLERAISRLKVAPQDLWIAATGSDSPDDWPWSTAPEFAEAASGVMALTGLPDGAPGMAEIPLASHTTGMMAAAGALFERRAAHLTARAARPLQIAMHEALMRMIEWQLPVAFSQGRAELRSGNRFPMNSNIGNIFQTADGTLLTISAATSSVADRLLGMIGGDELRQDPRFSSAQARRDNMDVLESMIAEWMAGRSGREAVEQMRAHDTVVGTIDDADALLADPHIAARGAFVDVAHGDTMLSMPAPMPRMDPPAGVIWRSGVAPGADTEAILKRIAQGESPWSFVPHTHDPGARSSSPAAATRTGGSEGASNRVSQRDATLPLSGLRVIELGSVIAAPFAASLLADLGAEVIKVERPEGDALRNMGLRDQGVPLWWGVASRAKRLCVMDLKDADDRARFLSLVDRADVLIENNRPGVMERLGLGWEALQSRNPRLVMLSISGFGQTGPYASRPGFGKIAEAFSGVVALTGERDSIPLHIGFSLADTAAGLAGVLGIAQSLHERDVAGTDRGRRIDLALYEPLLRMNECQTALARQVGRAPRRSGSADPWSFGASTPSDRRLVSARCNDGEWLVAIMNERSIAGLNGAGFQCLDALARTFSRGHALDRLKALGIEAVPVHDGWSLGADPYFVKRGDVRDTVDQGGRGRRVPGVTPRGYEDRTVPGFDAQPLAEDRSPINWRLS